MVFKTAIKKICDIYDWDGKGVLDMYFFGDILYALVSFQAVQKQQIAQIIFLFIGSQHHQEDLCWSWPTRRGEQEIPPFR